MTESAMFSQLFCRLNSLTRFLPISYMNPLDGKGQKSGQKDINPGFGTIFHTATTQSPPIRHDFIQARSLRDLLWQSDPATPGYKLSIARESGIFVTLASLP
jgi:hypothetical protein